MVERRPDPNDRRAWRLYLTDKSRPLIGQLRELGDQLMEQALQGVAADDRQRLGDILNTIRTNLSAGADQQEANQDRKSVVEGKGVQVRVSLGGARIHKKKK